jgi:hypothetical protein
MKKKNKNFIIDLDNSPISDNKVVTHDSIEVYKDSTTEITAENKKEKVKKEKKIKIEPINENILKELNKSKEEIEKDLLKNHPHYQKDFWGDGTYDYEWLDVFTPLNEMINSIYEKNQQTLIRITNSEYNDNGLTEEQIKKQFKEARENIELTLTV